MQFNWSPGIGDPTPMGWLTVVLYLAAAFTSYLIARRQPRPDAACAPLERRIWLGLAVLLLALGINKQLDLQSALTEAGRVLAHRQGWYGQRGAVQLVFVSGLVIAGLVASVLLFRWARCVDGHTRLALHGAVLLLCFVVIRAASIHHFDRFIDSRLLGLRWNWILEVGGIAVILGAGLDRLRASSDTS